MPTVAGTSRMKVRSGMAAPIVTRGREQYRLGLRPERLGDAGQQNVPDDLGAGRAARLARAHHLDAERSKPVRQQARMGRLAAALAAFEGDESSAHLV